MPYHYINDAMGSHIPQPQWLPNDFMVGDSLRDGDCFFDALAQGMNLLSIPSCPFNIKSLRQACSEHADNHQDWHQVIAKDAVMGGYATDSGQQADINNYLARIQLTAREMSTLNAGPAICGRPNIEGCMLCQKYKIKIHLIVKQNTNGQEDFMHQLVEETGLKPITVDESTNLYPQPGIVHILNEEQTHFSPVLPNELVKNEAHFFQLKATGSRENQLDRREKHLGQAADPVSVSIHSSQMGSLSDSSSLKRKMDLTYEEDYDIDAKKQITGLPEETEYFPASGIKSTLHGIAYQWKILMLCAQRSHHKGYNFRLATEMNAAEKFDDVVLEYAKQGSDIKQYRFLQAKHVQVKSEKNRITDKDLLEKEDKPFSLQKYFLSYQKIKRNLVFQSELQDFIIFTNNDFKFDDGFEHPNLKKLHGNKQTLYLEPVTEADDMLNIGGECYRLASTSHSERKEFVSALKSHFTKNWEVRMLANNLAQHLVHGGTIELRDLFKKYHRPLASCVFNIRDNKLAKQFVENSFDEQLYPVASAIRAMLHEAIEEELKRQPTKQRNEEGNKCSKPQPMKAKLTHQLADSEAFWHDIGQRELKFSRSFKQVFKPQHKPQLTDPNPLAEEMACLIKSKMTCDETINIQQGEGTVFNQELPHLVGHVFVQQGECVVFSNDFLTGSSLADDIKDLRNALVKKLELNNCHEFTCKLRKCKFQVNNFAIHMDGKSKVLLDSPSSLLELQVTDEEVDEFLNSLIFAVNQPNEKRLSEIISKELGHEFNLIDADLITSDFQTRILDWLKEKQGTYQSTNTIGKLLSDMREKIYQLILIGPTSEHIHTLEKYGIQFNDDVIPAALKEFLDLARFEDNKSIFNFITAPKQSFMGSIIVNQAIKDIDEYKRQGSFIFVRLNTLLMFRQEVFPAFSKEESKLLIVECKEEPADEIQTLFGKLSEIIKKRPGKKVILIAQENHPLASQFKTGEHKTRYQETVHEFKFEDLTPDSQKMLLEKKVKFQGSEITLNELVSTDSPITKILPIINLLEEKQLEIGQPMPVHKGYNESYYIERTFKYQSGENSTFYPPEKFEEFLLQAQRQKVLLISDIAGMGKTTILTHLCKQIKERFPSHWVVRIDLNDHTEALKDQENNKVGAKEFLSQELLKLTLPLEKKLFEHYFEESKVVIMLDGFDEISPSHERTVTDLLKDLKETSVEQLWVTTRPHLRKVLEQNLQQMSYTLEPFSKGDQVKFITTFWHQTLNIEGKKEQHLEEYATALIEKLEKSICDGAKKFTGIPLQTRLLAEAFCQSDIPESNLPKKLDLLDLYKRFTERKYDICQKRNTKATASNDFVKEQRDTNFKLFTKGHQLLALKVLFPEQVAGLFKDYSQSDPSTQHLARFGIVQSLDNKLYFIHRTFAEYYFADFLVQQFSKKASLPQEIQFFLLKDILPKENYQVIGSFLDGLLEESKSSKETLEQFGKTIHEMWKNEDGVQKEPHRSLGRTALHQAAQSGHTNIIRYLLASLTAAQHLESLHDLLLAEDSSGQTAWNLSAEHGHLKTLEELWQWGKYAKLNLKDDLLLAKDKNGQAAWHLAAWNSHPEVLKKSLELAEIELSQQELKHTLLDRDMEGRTVWHLAAWKNHPEVFKKLVEWSKKVNLSLQEFKMILLERDCKGRTPWHLGTLNNHPEVYEWANEATINQTERKELLKELFLDKDNDEQTIWHLASQSTLPNVFEKLLDVAEKTLSQEEIRQLLLTKNAMGRTAWHMSAENGRVESLITLWEWAKKANLCHNELKNNWLLAHDSRGTVWHLAAYRGHIRVLKKLWDWAKDEKLDLIYDLLLSKDEPGRNAGHLAAEYGNIETMEQMCDWAKEVKLNFKDDFLLVKDRTGRTTLDILKESPFVPEVVKSQVLQQWNFYSPED